MKNKLPINLYGSWLLSLTLLLAVSVTTFAQSHIKTEAQIEAERFEQQSLEVAGVIANQNSNRPMAFPDPYCEVVEFSWVEPISRVVFAGIDNPSPVDGNISHEDFTSVVGNVSAGETYSFAAEGDTGGNYTNFITVWIDWDQDGVFDEATERYEIGTLLNTNGEDGQQAVSDIEVPVDAVEGETRMRVVKKFSSAPLDSCNPSSSFGQAEDYTIEIGGGGSGGETCDDAIAVTSLPYDHGGNTADYGDNYSGGDVPPVATGAVTTGTGSTSYLNGDDVVYAYTPTDDEVLNISTTNDDDWIGLWAFTGCPFTSTVGYHTATSGGTRLIEELPVTAGETYYFVISTWPNPQSTEYTIHIEKVGGGGPAFDCEQDFAFSLDDGTGDLKNTLFADDFEIEAGNTMSVEAVTYRVFNNIGEATTIAFYEDAGGVPGDLVESFSNVAFDSQTKIGENYGFDAYDVEFTLPSAVDLGEGIYWLALQVTEGTDGGVNYWIITDDGVHAPGHYTDDGGVTWTSNSSAYDFSFKLEGECTSDGGTGGGFVCDDQFNVSNAIENGLFFGGSTNQSLAVDIIVGDDGFTAYGSNLNIFLAAGQTTDDVTIDLTFYDDQGGIPGNVTHSSAGTVKSTEFVGSNFGYDVYTFEVAFDDAADFDANKTYWMEVDSNGEAWEATTSGIFGSNHAFLNDNTSGDWVISGTDDLIYSLICEEFDDNTYCIPEGTNSNRYVDNFSTTGGTENISNMGSGFSSDGYGNFYDTHTVAQAQGEDIEFSVDIEGGISGFRVWVDWNQDGVFDITEEVAYASTGYANNHSGVITVPADALEGDTRMRIVSHWLSTSGDVDPCETGFTYGEFEDYKFTVGEGGGGGGTACDQVFYDVDQPTGIGFSSGNIVANDITVAAGESFTVQTMTFDVVNLGGEPSAFDLEIFEDNGSGGVGASTGVTHHFDSSNMTFVENGTFSIYTQYTVTLTLPDVELTAGASEDARYWLAVESELSTTGDFTYWVSYNYQTNPDSYPTWQYTPTVGSWFEYADTDGLTKEGIMTVSGICSAGGGDPSIYCEPELDCTDGDMITNVTFQEIDNTTACSPNGYGDYTHLVATVQSGGTYPISVTVGDGWVNESVSVWIDFDDSGTFDVDEFFYIGTGSDEALLGDIDIPTALADGEYRMRVRVAAVGEATATWDMSCDETQGFGETEDYTVEVDGALGIEDQSSTVFSYYPNPTSSVVNITANKDVSSVAVFNLLGQQVLAQNRLDNGQVDVTTLATGSYLFRVMFEDGSMEVFKVLKE